MQKITHQFLEHIGTSTTADWNTEDGTHFEGAHILIGHFLSDRDSPNPIDEKQLYSDDGSFIWGSGWPLEKVIRGKEDFDFLCNHVDLLRRSVFVIEPWQNVGTNDLGEEVQASKNVALIAKKVANADSVLLPAWFSGVIDPKRVASAASSSLAFVVEGGAPCVDDEASWSHPACPRSDMFALIEQLLMARNPSSGPGIFICVGHQLAAECMIRLIRRAVYEIEAATELPHDDDETALSALKAAAVAIRRVGEAAIVEKGDGSVVAQNWEAAQFAVTRNEVAEIGTRRLSRHRVPTPTHANLPDYVVDAYAVAADEHEGVIDTMIEYERDVHISMFHSDEVNETAMIFASWAFQRLHNTIVPHRHVVAGGSLSWMLLLPFAVEILSSTEEDGELVTEVSTMSIVYKDFVTKRIRRSFTCQFHPELLADLRAFGYREEASYAELKDDDGIRLFVRLLSEGMAE